MSISNQSEGGVWSVREKCTNDEKVLSVPVYLILRRYHRPQSCVLPLERMHPPIPALNQPFFFHSGGP